MIGSALNTLINFKCRTNDTTFPQTDKLYLVNTFKDEIASMIVERNKQFFLLPSTFNLVADQREYSFPADVLNSIHKLELKFAASDARFPSTAIKNYQGSETESEIVASWNNGKNGFAHYIRRNSLFILSGTIISVTGGGKLWYHLYPADLANLTGSTDLSIDPSTTTFGFPRQFHELLARRVAMEYKSRQPKPIPLNPMERNYAIDLETQLAAISATDNSEETLGDMPSGTELWNNGQNL
jgi:hypothetical protein